jgi:hypothetical protein
LRGGPGEIFREGPPSAHSQFLGKKFIIMIKIKRLRSDLNLIGKIHFPNANYQCLLSIKEDLQVHIFSPVNEHLTWERFPSEFDIKAEYDEWLIGIKNIKGTLSRTTYDFSGVKEILKHLTIDWEIFPKEVAKKLWLKWSFYPEQCRFIRKDHMNEIPSRWGITFYPEKSMAHFLHYFCNDRRGPLGLPLIFYGVDHSIYLDNHQKWDLESINNRLKLITMILSLFKGNPLTYQLLIGRMNNDVVCLQFNIIVDKHKHFNADLPNAYVGLKKEYQKEFSETFVKKIDLIFNNSEIDKIMVILFYYRNLLVTYFDEDRLAFSYQIIESIARYLHMKMPGESYKAIILKKVIRKHKDYLCTSCLNILIKESESTGESSIVNLIFIAAKVLKIEIKADDIELLLDLSRFYRNQFFHGDFLENNERIDKAKIYLVGKYNSSLTLIIQSIVYLIGVGILLGIDYEMLIAYKKG